MNGSEWSKREQWTTATVAALASLAENFPTESGGFQQSSAAWGELTPRNFPCQKSDLSSGCPGWSLGRDARFAAPGMARPCPCVCGRGLKFGPLLALAAEFPDRNPSLLSSMPSITSSFLKVESQLQLRAIALHWMWLAACAGFRPQHEGLAIQQVQTAELSPTQRQTLRWWTRLIELSGLVQNEVFTILTQSALENLYRQRGVVAQQVVFDSLRPEDGQIFVLLLNGNDLTPAGFHSERHAWLDSFLGIVDERQLGLSVVSRQPLLNPETGFSGKKSAEFRWKARHQVDGAQFALQQVVRRGAWDRLCESLARGELLMQSSGLLKAV